MNVDYISMYNLVNAGHSVISTLCNGRGTEVFVNALQTNQPLIWHLRRLLLHASGMKVEGGDLERRDCEASGLLVGVSLDCSSRCPLTKSVCVLQNVVCHCQIH